MEAFLKLVGTWIVFRSIIHFSSYLYLCSHQKENGKEKRVSELQLLMANERSRREITSATSFFFHINGIHRHKKKKPWPNFCDFCFPPPQRTQNVPQKPVQSGHFLNKKTFAGMTLLLIINISLVICCYFVFILLMNLGNSLFRHHDWLKSFLVRRFTIGWTCQNNRIFTGGDREKVAIIIIISGSPSRTDEPTVNHNIPRALEWSFNFKIPSK